jgi:hypothetical protein
MCGHLSSSVQSQAITLFPHFSFYGLTILDRSKHRLASWAEILRFPKGEAFFAPGAAPSKDAWNINKLEQGTINCLVL